MLFIPTPCYGPIGNVMYKGGVRVFRMLVTAVLTSAFISSHYSVKYFSFCIADLSTLS